MTFLPFLISLAKPSSKEYKTTKKELLEPIKKLQIKELTDEEIENIQKQFYQIVTNHDKDFARAILRKAQENG